MLSFFSVMTKTLKFFTALIALTLATPAWAQGPGVTPPPLGGDDEAISTSNITTFYIYLHWLRSQGSANSAPLAYADGTPLQGGDVVALLFVIPEEGVTFGANDNLPFSINADSSVALKAGAKRAIWAGYTGPSEANKGIAIDLENPGYPKGQWYDWQGIIPRVDPGFAWPSEVEGVGAPETCAVYLVALGSRAWEWDAETQSYVSVSANTNPLPEGGASKCDLPSCVTEWSAVWCMNVVVGDRFTGGPLGRNIVVNIPDDAHELLKEAYSTFSKSVNGEIAAVDKAPTLETVVVDGQELSGADLEAALKPTVSGMVATTIGEGDTQTPAFGLTFTPAQLPGLSTYTLYTATDLAGPWQPFDKVLEEKELANPSGMRYTTLRIDGEESVPMTIPRLENDPTRFYRLQGDVEVVTTDQEGE